MKHSVGLSLSTVWLIDSILMGVGVQAQVWRMQAGMLGSRVVMPPQTCAERTWEKRSATAEPFTPPQRSCPQESTGSTGGGTYSFLNTTSSGQ